MSIDQFANSERADIVHSHVCVSYYPTEIFHASLERSPFMYEYINVRLSRHTQFKKNSFNISNQSVAYNYKHDLEQDTLCHVLICYVVGLK